MNIRVDILGLYYHTNDIHVHNIGGWLGLLSFADKPENAQKKVKLWGLLTLLPRMNISPFKSTTSVF